MIWEWRRPARTPGSLVSLGMIWALVIGLWAGIDLHPVLAALLLVATLPALLDVWRGNAQNLSVFKGKITWATGRKTGEVSLAEGSTISLRRRFDGGLRIVLTDRFGQETRLPAELSPPLAPLEAALQQTPATVRRDPFRLI